MPKTHVRLSAGRESMSDEMQAMCFLAGANSIFYGECLLTTPNPEAHEDMTLFARLGITPEQAITKLNDKDQESVLTKQLQKNDQAQPFYDATV